MEKNEIEEDKLYCFYLCPNKRYKVSEIKLIDGEYVVKIGTHPSGVNLFTPNYGYKFDYTMQEGELVFTFRERIKLKEEATRYLKML